MTRSSLTMLDPPLPDRLENQQPSITSAEDQIQQMPIEQFQY